MRKYVGIWFEVELKEARQVSGFVTRLVQAVAKMERREGDTPVVFFFDNPPEERLADA